MAYLACTIVLLIYTCKTSKLSLMSRTYKCFHHGYKCLHMFSMVNQCHSGFTIVPPELKSLTKVDMADWRFLSVGYVEVSSNHAGEGRHRVLVSGASSPNTLVTTGKKYLPWLISFNQCIHSKQQRPLLASPHRKRRYPITFIAWRLTKGLKVSPDKNHQSYLQKQNLISIIKRVTHGYHG